MKKTSKGTVATATRRTAPKSVPVEEQAGRKWYVLCVESGKEMLVRADLLKRAKIAGLWPTFYKSTLVPVQREMVPREGDGKLVMKSTIKYEGYVFVNMIWCPATYDLVKESRYQFGLLPGRPARPAMPPNKIPSAAQEAEFARWVNWAPQGLPSSEAAGLLLEQQATFKKKLPPPPKFLPGAEVEIIHPTSAYYRMSGPLSIAHDDSLTVTVKVLGIDMKVPVEQWQIKNKGE